MLIAQFCLILASVVIIFFKEKRACGAKYASKALMVRFGLSTLSAIAIIISLVVINSAKSDQELSYLATNHCSDDASLESSFTTISTYISKTNGRWIVSLIFLILVLGLDITQVLLQFFCLKRSKSAKKKSKKASKVKKSDSSSSSSSSTSSSSSSSDDDKYRKH